MLYTIFNNAKSGGLYATNISHTPFLMPHSSFQNFLFYFFSSYFLGIKVY